MDHEPQEIRMATDRRKRGARHEALHRARRIVKQGIESGADRVKDASTASTFAPSVGPGASMGSIPAVPQTDSPGVALEEAFADLPTLPRADSQREELTLELMEQISTQLEKLDEYRVQLTSLLDRIK